jgi:putative tryptophan/tyrosine transport system substrate-binding protein
MRRREFITLLCGVAACPLAALAQTPSKTYHVGLLGPQAIVDDRIKALVQGLAKRGYIEGRNLVILKKSAEGRNER